MEEKKSTSLHRKDFQDIIYSRARSIIESYKAKDPYPIEYLEETNELCELLINLLKISE